MSYAEDDAIQALFDALGEVPVDVVERGELTAETVRQLDAMAGHDVQVTWPGEPIQNAEGDLIGMTSPVTETVTMAAPSISDAERKRLGVPDPHDVVDGGAGQESRQW